MRTIYNKNYLNLAFKAFSKNPFFSLKRVIKIYSVPYSTLFTRENGTCARRDTIFKIKKLTDLEESTILKKNTRAKSPRISS